MNNFNRDFLLRLFLGLAFLSAGIYRIFHWQNAILEVINLHLPAPALFSFLVIILEITGGLALIFNIHVKKTLSVFITFLVLTLLWTLVKFWQNLISDAGILFTFNTNPTDFFLHFTYLIILIYLFCKPKQ